MSLSSSSSLSGLPSASGVVLASVSNVPSTPLMLSLRTRHHQQAICQNLIMPSLQRQKKGRTVCLFLLLLYIYVTYLELASEPSGEDENKIAIEITFNISFYPLKESSKKVKKRTSCHSSYMKLNNEEPFNTFKAQLLVQIDKQFTPKRLNINNFQVFFSIPRTSPMPMVLAENEDYQIFLKHITKVKDHTCTIYVQQLVDEKANKVCYLC